MARELTYTTDVHDRIVRALKAGASLRDAVGFSGAAWRTFCDWLRAGRRAVEHGPEASGADERFAQLAMDVDQAIHEADVALVGCLRRAAEAGEWRAAEALLKHRADSTERRLRQDKLRAEIALTTRRVDGTLPAEKHDVTATARVVLLPPEDPDDDGGGVAAEPGTPDALSRQPRP